MIGTGLRQAQTDKDGGTCLGSEVFNQLSGDFDGL